MGKRGGKEGERQRKMDRQRETEGEREKETDTERQTDREERFKTTGNKDEGFDPVRQIEKNGSL